VGVRLALLAKGTTFDIFAHEVGKTRPPVFSGNELACFKITRMAGRGVIMGSSDNVAMKRTQVRDVDTVLVGEETTIDLPVGEARTEGRGNCAVKGLESIADEDIVAGGGGDEIT
jgi:hypothetical protein